MEINYQWILNKFRLGKITSATELSGGLINPTYLINDKFVLKLESQKYESNPDKFKKEAFLFSVLPKYGIPTPKVIAFDDSLELINTPYLLLEYIQGQDIAHSWGSLSSSQQYNVAHELGVIAKKIHSLTLENLENYPLLSQTANWLKSFMSEFDKHWQIVENTNLIPNSIKNIITHNHKLFINLYISQEERLTHGDLFTAGNVQLLGDQIIGLFDFEYASFADPLRDFQKLPLAFQLKPAFNQQSFLNGYGIKKFTKEEKIRLKMYCFDQAVWEIWAVITQFMPFGDKEILQAQQLITNTITSKLFN